MHNIVICYEKLYNVYKYYIEIRIITITVTYHFQCKIFFYQLLNN